MSKQNGKYTKTQFIEDIGTAKDFIQRANDMERIYEGLHKIYTGDEAVFPDKPMPESLKEIRDNIRKYRTDVIENMVEKTRNFLHSS